MIDAAGAIEMVNRHLFLPPPRRIIIVHDRIYGEVRVGNLVYRLLVKGMRPSWLPGTIVLSAPEADEKTVTHEMIHLAGLGELAAKTLAPVLSRIARARPGLLRRRLRYRRSREEEEKLSRALGAPVEVWVLAD